MKKIIFIIFFTLLIFSCNQKKDFNQKKYESVSTTMNGKQEIKKDNAKTVIFENDNDKKNKNHEKKIINASPQFSCWITSKEGLRVRNIPDLSGEKISLLDYKTKIDVYEIGKKVLIDNKLGFWLKIKIDNTYGWIFSGYVTVIPENPYNEPDILPLTNETLAGTWTTRKDSFSIIGFSFGEVFEKDGGYYSGLLHSSWGTKGNFEINSEANEVIIKSRVIDDTYIDENISISILKIQKLTSDELIYNYISEENGSDSKKQYCERRIPLRFLELKESSTIGWLQYINKYGNEELFTGSTVFMYAIFCKKNDVAVFLINSDIDINHKNYSGEKASDFFRGNTDEYLFEILKPEIKEIKRNDKTEKNDSIEFEPLQYDPIVIDGNNLI